MRRFSRIAWLVTKSVLFAAVIAIGIGAVIYVSSTLGERRQAQRARALYAQVENVIKKYDVRTVRGSAAIRIKCLPDGKVAYQFSFRCQPGMIISEQGSFTVQFVDDQGFLIEEKELSDLTNIVAPDSLGTDMPYGASSNGTIALALDSYVRIAGARVSHSATIVPMREQSAAMSSNYDDSWAIRASHIRIGMTYFEMVRAAGEPRTTAVAGPPYDRTKYNYGSKWVYFRDNLVQAVK